MFWVYVLWSEKDHRLYTGFTIDPTVRERLHNSGKVISTKHRGKLKMIYLEGCINNIDAIRREKYLKSGRGKILLKSRLKYWYKEDINTKEPGPVRSIWI